MKSFVKSHIALTILICLIIVVVITISILTVCARSIPEDAPDRASVGILPTDAQLAAAVKYDRVLIIGVDGAGGYFGDMDTPNFDKMFPADSSSITYTGLSQYPTVSAQNWTSMLHGVRYQKHGITNDISGEKPYTDDRYPSVFKVYAAAHPEAKFLSGCTWANVNNGIIEQLDSVVKVNVDDYKDAFDGSDKTGASKDRATVDLTLAKLDEIDPVITYFQLDQVDHVGHDVGYGKPEFAAACTSVDKLIGQIYDAYAAKGWADDTLFIAVSDHGHLPWGGHGTNTANERYVMVAVAGAKGNIVKGTPGKVVTQDIASIVMYALGEKQPDSWESKVPYDMFTTLE